MITYLTQLLTLPIVGQDGTKAGRILDALAEQGGRLPTLVALYIKGKEAEGWVRLENATISDTGVILKGNLSSLTTHQPGEGDLRLQRDILD